MNTALTTVMDADHLHRRQWWYAAAGEADGGRTWRAVSAERAEELRRRGVSACYASAAEMLAAGETLVRTPDADAVEAQAG